MSIMDNDKLPKRPVVTSKTAADAEFDYWLKENNFSSLKDGDGLAWNLNLKIARVPEPAAREAPWTLTLHLTAQVNAKTLVETHTLEPDLDSRLIELIGEHTIDINLKPIQRKAMTKEDARRMLAVVLPETRDKVALASFREIKRSLVGRWIDQTRVFGAMA